ncbi:MAG: YihY/virulence factor BrkB family protein [Candidatus Choladocola sp.]|nr:YihY/virulence factor BrkB family protein [Candidatus Choladocola sp.]
MSKIYKLEELIRKFIRKTGRDRVRAHSAEAAFFIIMSCFPVLMLLLALIQFTPIDQEQVIFTLEEMTPFEVSGILKPAVQSIFTQSSALVPWTILVAIWSGGKGTLGLTDGLNSIFQIEERRNYLVTRIRAACYTFVMILALIVSITIMVFGYELQNYLKKMIPFLDTFTENMFPPMLIALAVLVLLFAILYTFLPNRRMKFRSQIPGAVFTALSWSVFSYAFSIYLDFAVNMSVIYGSLTTLVVVMLWLYSCMYLLFIGAEINQYIANPELFALDR